MKVPPSPFADDAEAGSLATDPPSNQLGTARTSASSIFGHQSCDCLVRMPDKDTHNSSQRTAGRDSYPGLPGLGSRKSMGSALLDPGDFTSTRRSSRLPSQQDADSCVAPGARDRVKLRLRCVYCGAIMGCVLGLALLVGAGLSFAIYLGCLSVETQRTAWLRRNRLLPPSNASSSPALPPAVRYHIQQQQHSQEEMKIPLRTGIVLGSLGIAALALGIISCCLHPIASEHRRRPFCGCFRRPLKLSSASAKSRPQEPPVRVRNSRSVSTGGGASPQHLLAVFSTEQAAGGHVTQQDGRTSRSTFFRRFSFL